MTSGMLSLVKSAMTMPEGPRTPLAPLTCAVSGVDMPPSGSEKKMLTSKLVWLLTARSARLSPSRSATAMTRGPVPTGKVTGARSSGRTSHRLAVHTLERQSVLTTQALSTAHLPQVAPPQSTSVSVPLRTPSVQVAPAQTPTLQTRALQSPATWQFFPGGQTGHVPPPQSASVSSAFFTPSKQVAVLHTLLLLQTPDVQSGPTPQVFPLPQAAHTGPPQSTSVSMPSFAPLLHAAEMHRPSEHCTLAQSVGILQALPAAHAGQVPPPQSTSASAPFLTVSVQDGAWQTPPWQLPEAHCALSVQVLPVAQAVHVSPQSTSPSLPFLTRSVHDGAAQMPPEVHTRLAQSAARLQSSLTPQGAQEPPQSRSLSEPSLTPFLQVLNLQMPWPHVAPLGHTTPTQVASTHAPATHTCRLAHAVAPQDVGRHEPAPHNVLGWHVTPKHAVDVQTSATHTLPSAQVPTAQALG